MPEIGDEAAYNRALLENATYGLSALETLVDDLEGRLTAARAGYLDNINNSELAQLVRYQRSNHIIFSTGNVTAAAGATYYPCMAGYGYVSAVTAEFSYSVFLITRAGTIKNLIVFTGVAPGAGESYVYTVRQNQADSAITCTISGATDKTASDLVNTLTVAVGDIISIKLVVSNGAAAVRHIIMLEFQG